MNLILFPYHMLRWAHTVWAMQYVCPTTDYYLELIHCERKHREKLNERHN